MRKTLIFLAVSQLLICAPVLAQEKSLLFGNIEIQDSQAEKMPVLVRQEAQLDLAQAEDAGKPTWIEGSVYSNAKMKMRVWKRMFAGIIKADLPATISSQLTIKDKVLSFWKGSIPKYPCKVTCKPYGPKGNYRFYASNNGPRGYLENMGRDEDGFATYKYWFEKPQYISKSL
ncbi:MAG: hypothetical protein KIT34_03665 [Cyanobacteria bacterium TGS_CYA1]|nr:hypothetical protein [Cyanobacteria bacterium TGS_CYA1]